MAILDYNLVFSDAQAVTATAASTSYVDQGAASDAVQPGAWVEFLVDPSFTSNSATIQFELQFDDNTSFSSPQTLFITPAIADTTLIAGYRVARFKIPIGAERYIQAKYTVSGTAVAGKVDARIVNDVDVLLP